MKNNSLQVWGEKRQRPREQRSMGPHTNEEGYSLGHREGHCLKVQELWELSWPCTWPSSPWNKHWDGQCPAWAWVCISHPPSSQHPRIILTLTAASTLLGDYPAEKIPGLALHLGRAYALPCVSNLPFNCPREGRMGLDIPWDDGMRKGNFSIPELGIGPELSSFGIPVTTPPSQHTLP